MWSPSSTKLFHCLFITVFLLLISDMQDKWYATPVRGGSLYPQRGHCSQVENHCFKTNLGLWHMKQVLLSTAWLLSSSHVKDKGELKWSPAGPLGPHEQVPGDRVKDIKPYLWGKEVKRGGKWRFRNRWHLNHFGSANSKFHTWTGLEKQLLVSQLFLGEWKAAAKDKSQRTSWLSLRSSLKGGSTKKSRVSSRADPQHRFTIGAIFKMRW